MQLTLEAASPGGRVRRIGCLLQRDTRHSLSASVVRKRAYDVATTPPDESAGDRAKRKSANRNSALRARKALAQEPPPATAPPVALELVPPSTRSAAAVGCRACAAAASWQRSRCSSNQQPWIWPTRWAATHVARGPFWGGVFCILRTNGTSQPTVFQKYSTLVVFTSVTHTSPAAQPASR